MRCEVAALRDLAVHDAVRLLGLVPAQDGASGYDARDPERRYRIEGCVPGEARLAPGAFCPGEWERGLLVSMTMELKPVAIDELSFAATRARRSVAWLRAAGERRWERK